MQETNLPKKKANIPEINEVKCIWVATGDTNHDIKIICTYRKYVHIKDTIITNTNAVLEFKMLYS